MKRKAVPSRSKRGFIFKDRTHKAVLNCAASLMESLDTPVSLGVYLRMKYQSWEEVSSLTIDPLNYNCAIRFRSDYVAVNFLRKYPLLPIAVNRKVAAISKFYESESSCALTNARLLTFKHRLLKPLVSDTEKVILLSQRKIARVLSDLNLNLIFEGMRWGPGATYSLGGADVSNFTKFNTVPEVTLGCLPYAQAAINSTPSWAKAVLGSDDPCSVLSSVFQVVPGNRITTVPKDARIDRVIAIEPAMNIYCQLGVGAYIRQSLRKVGVDLDKGQSRNSFWARIAAVSGSHATIDLSSASDCVSYQLVKLLLPEEWFNLLNRLRSHYGQEGKDFPPRLYTKFSSMGNGFTFELESLIFWAVSSATLDVRNADHSGLCIYGDDIIVPSSCYELLTSSLSFLGFDVNVRKSFRFSYFRESCGEHFFNNIDVKPVYVDKVLRTSVDVMALSNQIVSLAGRFGNSLFDEYDSRFLSARSILIAAVPSRDRFFVPVGYEGGFVGSFDECLPRILPGQNQIEGFTYPRLVPVPKRRRADGLAVLPWALSTLKKSSEFSVRRLSRHEYNYFWSVDQDRPPSQGVYPLRGDPRCFKPKRLLVRRPVYVGVWQ